jgi:hypothetical protein
MREIAAAVVFSALLGMACDAKTNASAPAASSSASTAVAPAAPAAAPAATPAEKPRSEAKAHEGTRVARARHTKKLLTATGKKAGATDAADPAGAPAVRLSQSPPSSY